MYFKEFFFIEWNAFSLTIALEFLELKKKWNVYQDKHFVTIVLEILESFLGIKQFKIKTMNKIDNDIPKVRVVDFSRCLTIESIEIQHKVRIVSYCGGGGE